MQHVSLKATTTDTDQDLGTFEAVASAWSTDREGDEIAPSAFDRTIEAWRRSEKYMPLLFEHTSVTVGWLDPEQMRTDARGLVVAGEVDRTSEQGEIAWRSIRQNTAGFSIGFVAEGRPRKRGKGRLITEVDLLEISWTATPVHPATRVLSWKSDRGDWRDVPRYRVPGRRDPVNYWGLMAAMDVKKAVVEIEAEEQAAAETAAREATEKAAAVPTTDKPFQTDDGKRLVECSAEGCHAIPTTAAGSWRPVADRRWWCDTHKHLAGPEDHLPPEPTWLPKGCGGRRLNPKSEEGQRVRAEFERQQAEERKREEHEQREAETLAKVRQTYERTAVISVQGRRVHPADLHFHGR